MHTPINVQEEELRTYTGTLGVVHSNQSDVGLSKVNLHIIIPYHFHSTNPVEIYKQWLNQLETDSGKTAGMPYDVTVAQALEYDEVQKRFSRSLTRLKQVKENLSGY